MSRLIRICLLIKYSLLSWFILISLLHNAMRKFGTFFMGHPVYTHMIILFRIFPLGTIVTFPVLNCHVLTFFSILHTYRITRTFFSVHVLHDVLWGEDNEGCYSRKIFPKIQTRAVSEIERPMNSIFEDPIKTVNDNSWVVYHYRAVNPTWLTSAILNSGMTS